MSKKIRFVLAFVLLVLASTSAFAVGGFKTLYYSDASLTSVIGGRYYPDYDCPENDLWWRYGSTSAYKKTFEYTDCYEYGSVTITCYVNGSVVTCP